MSLRVGGTGAAGALAAGVWLAWTMATREFRGARAVAAVASLPAAMPPLIFGAYLTLDLAGRADYFTWSVAAIAAAASGVPEMARAARAAFDGLPRVYGNAARCLGAPGWRVFWRVTAPLAYRPILAAGCLAFARLAAEYAFTILLAAHAGTRSAMLGGPLLPSVGSIALAAVYAAMRIEGRRARA